MSAETITQKNSTLGIKPTAPWRIKSIDALPNYCLTVTCNDGTNGIVDLSRLIFSQKTGIYAALKDEKLFNQVRIELGVPVWPNDADLDPAWIHEAVSKNKCWCVPE